MDDSIFTLIVQFLELQSELHRQEASLVVRGLGDTELQVLKTIKELKQPNVTEMARKLKMTKGAISKNTRKLLGKELIESYMEPGNNQKIFFRLSRQGEIMYQACQKQDERWKERNLEYLRDLSKEELRVFWVRLQMYNNYLREEIAKSSKYTVDREITEAPEADDSNF